MKKMFFFRNRRTNTKNRKSVKKRNFRINEKFHGFSRSGYSRIRWSRFESTGESDDKKNEWYTEGEVYKLNENRIK